MARDTEAPHGTLHLGSITWPDGSKDVQAIDFRDGAIQARANARVANINTNKTFVNLSC
jgi:hypothetical protein